MMKLKHDFIIDLATGFSRNTVKWRNRQWRWSELVERCSKTQYTGETTAEYAKMSKEEQSNIKDVGGFVGGYLSEGRRKSANVLYRTVATLDIDYGTAEVWEDFTMAFNCAAMLYSTHKHSDEHPRYRLVVVFNRQVKPAEYEPLCRAIAATVGIDRFDDTTYETARLFYYPSTSKGAPFVFKYQDGPALDVDKILAQYVDPYDASSWPMSSREGDVIAHEVKKAGDPTEKPGVIGAFCRTYTIEDAIAHFLGDYYEPTATPGRYTYKLGSVAGGLVCYEGKYAYSHHETDPAGGQLCNAFDLCRIHLYGVKDEGSRAADITRKPSYKAMVDFVDKDPNVKITLATETKKAAADDFEDVELPEDYSDEWKKGLEFSNGRLVSSIANVTLILENDPEIAGHLTHDLFSGFDAVRGGLPWNKKAEEWSDRDDGNLRAWLEKKYAISGKEKINDAVTTVLTRHSFHPIRDYLGSLIWDREPRLDRLIIDYLGAEDTELNRAMTRKHFVAAVARVFNPGVKYDQCLVMEGPEGAGKSTLLNIMGGRWFNDSITTTEGKEGMDQLRRSWVIELGELSSIKRNDVESVKAYLSKRVDIYRAAYDRRTLAHPRQCVFCGTTNETNFLKGDTGNRRFWIISVRPELRKHQNWHAALTRDRDQLWAEAVHYFNEGEQLYLTGDMEKEAREMQKNFNDDNDDPMVSLLYRFLDMPLPTDWGVKDILQRRRWIRENAEADNISAKGEEKRTRVCALEFLCEMLGKDVADKEIKYLARRVNKIIEQLPNWEKLTSTRHVERLYGLQRGFRRKEDFSDNI